MEDEPASSPQFSTRPNKPVVSNNNNNNTIIATGPLRLVTLQEPQENFHKDEGGKANQLTFRLILQGELTPEVLGQNATLLDNPESFLPLSVRPIFDDGELADASVLEIVGGTEGPHPCIQISTRLGGVRYRLRTVSKRLGNRGIGVIVEVVGCSAISPLKSETTMVFSKRKNKEQRLEEQARERNELLERQRAAASLLNTRSIGSSGSLLTSPPTLNAMLQSSATGIVSPQMIPTPSLSSDPQQYVVRVPVGGNKTLRKLSSVAADSDSDESFEQQHDDRHSSSARNSSINGAKKKHKSSISSPSASALTTTTTMSSYAGGNPQKVEERLLELEAAHERLKQEVDYLRGSIHLHMLQNTRSSSSINSNQTVAWEFVDPGDRPSVVGGGGGLLAGMASPPPSRTPLGELETSWGLPPMLRRDMSGGSQTFELLHVGGGANNNLNGSNGNNNHSASGGAE